MRPHAARRSDDRGRRTTAIRWSARKRSSTPGAQRLHVIDLDGAFGSGENLAAVERICTAVDVPVQTGGGLRALKHAEEAFAAGAGEIILGTLLVEDERLARHIIEPLPREGDRRHRRARLASRDARLAGAHAGRSRRARAPRRAVGRFAGHLHRDSARRDGRRLRHRRAQRGRQRRPKSR